MPVKTNEASEVIRMFWLPLTALFIGSIVAYDLWAMENPAWPTYSLYAGPVLVRAPYIVFALVGSIAHMALQQTTEIADGYSALVMLIITAIYAAIWHSGQWYGWWEYMGYWTMYFINFVAGPVIWSTIFSLKPTY